MKHFRLLILLSVLVLSSVEIQAQTIQHGESGESATLSMTTTEAFAPFLAPPEYTSTFEMPEGVITAQLFYADTSTNRILENFPSPTHYVTSAGNDTEAAKTGIEVRFSAPFPSSTYLDSIRFYGAFPKFDSTLGSQLIVGAWPSRQGTTRRFADYGASPYFKKRYFPSAIPVGTRGWFHVDIPHVLVDSDFFVSIFITDTSGAAIMQIGLDSVATDTTQLYDASKNRLYWVLPETQLSISNGVFVRYPGLYFHSNAYVIAYITNAKDGVTESSATTQFHLKQNFPNPANTTTSIEYELARESSVSLKLYDAIGREVRSLIEPQIQSSGSHELKFDASTLTVGIYYYVLRSGSQQQARVMQVVR